MKQDWLITFRSVTLAQKGERALKQAEIFCSLQRTPKMLSERGCGYCLRLRWYHGDRAITALREKYPDTIVVGIEPALKSAAKAFPGGTIGVMATPATLRETKFAHLMELFATECTVVKLPAVGLVERIESGKADSKWVNVG